MKFRTSVYATLLNPIFQSKEFEGSGGLMVEIIILIYIFFGFGVMCDKYLIPSIEKIKERYHISERLAGSTILALGSSISLIASNMNAVLLNKPNEFELGLTAILGAAIFEFSIGFAIGCMLIKKNYKICYNVLFRDFIIYMFTILLLYSFLKDKCLDLTKSIILLSLWIFYMIYLILTSSEDDNDMTLIIVNNNEYFDKSQFIEKYNNSDYNEKTNNIHISELPTNLSRNYPNNTILKLNNNHEKKEIEVKLKFKNFKEERSQLLEKFNQCAEYQNKTYNSNCECHRNIIKELNESNRLNQIEIKDEKNYLLKKFDQEKYNKYKHFYIKNVLIKFNSNQSLINLLVKGFLKATSKPWEMLLDIFTPKSNEGYYLFIKFVIPLIFIWNFSEVELYVLEKIMSRLKVQPSFLGLTIMSWGNNAPDMYNVASAMAKGLVDLALNAAIASEIHNILLGLGLPWLVYNLTIGKPIEFHMNDLYSLTIFFFCIFLLVFLAVLKINKKRFDVTFAFFLIFIYLIFLMLIFVLSFNIKVW